MKFVENVWHGTSVMSVGVKFVGSAWSSAVGFVQNATAAVAERLQR